MLFVNIIIGTQSCLAIPIEKNQEVIIRSDVVDCSEEVFDFLYKNNDGDSYEKSKKIDFI